MTVSDRPFRIEIDIFDGVYDEVPAHASEKDLAQGLMSGHQSRMSWAQENRTREPPSTVSGAVTGGG